MSGHRMPMAAQPLVSCPCRRRAPQGATLRLVGDEWPLVRGVVVRGHRVASGAKRDPRFPEGTLAMQTPHFRAAGIDITGFHGGTLNLDIAPSRIVIVDPVVTLRDVRWHPTEPPEDFSFVECRIGTDPDDLVAGLVYHPHPETKPEHYQPPTIVEVIAPWIDGAVPGAALVLAVAPGQARFSPA